MRVENAPPVLSLLIMCLVIDSLSMRVVDAQTPVSAANFNPSNNVVRDGTFTNSSQIMMYMIPYFLDNSTTELKYASMWKIQLVAANQVNVPLPENTTGFNYTVSTVNGKNALEVTVPAGDRITIWQTLHGTIINSTTNVHVAIDYLTGPTTAEVTAVFGTFSSGNDVAFQPFTPSMGWQNFDMNINTFVGENITGSYFDCPSLQDVEFTNFQPASQSFTFAITDVAVYDQVPPPPVVQIVTQNVTQTVVKYVNQTVYVPQYVNRTVTLNNTVTVPEPYPVATPLPYYLHYLVLGVLFLVFASVYTFYCAYRERKKGDAEAFTSEVPGDVRGQSHP